MSLPIESGYLGVHRKFLPERTSRSSFNLLSNRAGCLQIVNIMEEMKFHKRKWGTVTEGEWMDAGSTFEGESCSDGTFVI